MHYSFFTTKIASPELWGIVPLYPGLRSYSPVRSSSGQWACARRRQVEEARHENLALEKTKQQEARSLWGVLQVADKLARIEMAAQERIKNCYCRRQVCGDVDTALANTTRKEYQEDMELEPLAAFHNML